MPVALKGYAAVLATRVRESTAFVLPEADELTSSTDTVPGAVVDEVTEAGDGEVFAAVAANLRAFLAAAWYSVYLSGCAALKSMSSRRSSWMFGNLPQHGVT